MTAPVVPFPPCRRLDFVYRHARIAADLRPDKGRLHIERQVEDQRRRLTAKRVEPELVAVACEDLRTALNNALNRVLYEGSGAA